MSVTEKEMLRATPTRPQVTSSMPQKLPVGARVTNWLAVILPLLGLVIAAVLWSLRAWGWLDLVLFAVLYFLTALGITLGFHRYFTHRSFDTYPFIEALLGVLGSMSVQGPLLKWVALHRRHHQYSDQPGDPHSPHLCGPGALSVLRGWWHAHVGWIFLADPPGLHRYITDLKQSRLVRTISQLFPLWVLVGLLAPAVLGGLLTGTWLGAVTGFVWGGLVRIFAVHHVTWSINSICHLWGARYYRTDDESRDNWVFGILGLGEGWHHSHHAFPTSARHGLRWWQLDITYLVLKLLETCKLAWNVRIPRASLIAARQL